MTEMVKFSATFNICRKCISVCNVADLFNIVCEKFKDCPMFPENISLQFEEEGVTEFVDQDSLLQVAQRRSNRLLVISDTTATEETALSETDSSDDPLQEYPLLL